MKTRLTTLAGALGLMLLFFGAGHRAQAQEVMTFGGGVMKNLYIDLVFWGPFTAQQQQDVRDYVTDLQRFLNGETDSAAQFGFPGFEAAVHYYGVQGIFLGNWIALDQTRWPLGPFASGGSERIDETIALNYVQAAQTGVFGPSQDVFGNQYPAGLPTGANRLALVMTVGANRYSIGLNALGFGMSCVGFHTHSGNTLYGAVQWDVDPATMAHEIFEAMTDPFADVVTTSEPGWAGSLKSNLTVPEVGDQCESSEYYGPPFAIGSTWSYSPDFEWTGTNADSGANDDITGLPPITVNNAFAEANYPQVSCQLTIPEQHAPMAATFEHGGNGQQPLMLFYTTPAGHIGVLQWNAPGYAPLGPYDLGQPSPSVTAVGKPSVAYSFLGGGEYIFVKGSDGAVWMHTDDGIWTSLGGVIYGEPSAVAWTWQGSPWIHVVGLGTDDAIYGQGVRNRTPFGWGQVPTNGTSFVGSPTAISRTADSLDLFAVGEDGYERWMTYSPSTDWVAPVKLGVNSRHPMLATPRVAAQGSSLLELFANSEMGMWQTSWDGSSWSLFGNGMFQMPYPDVNYGYQGTPAAVSWGAGRFDVFNVTRNGTMYWWYSTYPTSWNSWTKGTSTGMLVSGNVTGDPVAISRSTNELEVFYRTMTGSLVHMTYMNRTWTSENLLGPNAIR